MSQDELDEITALRALAHMLKYSSDLAPYADHILETDYLAPEDRIASWRSRIGRDNGTSA